MASLPKTEGNVAKKSKSQWFGSTVMEATDGSSSLPSFPFPEKLRCAIEPHVAKAETRRHLALMAIRRATTESKYDSLMNEFSNSKLSRQDHFGFDTKRYPLRQAFQEALGLPPDKPFSSIHEQTGEFNKLHLLRNMTLEPEIFQTVFDKFVREVCCPRLQMLYGDTNQLNEIFYQCFPCVRIIQPGEFSIGPHADVSYGHHPLSTNFYILLTDLSLQESSAALFLESRLGSGDWHPILGNYGQVHHFPGAICAHWTTENKTKITRVSLDFRLLPGPWYHAMADGQPEDGGQSDVYRQREGYYSRCIYRHETDPSKEEFCSVTQWERIGPLQVPDARVGFPWTVASWGKLLGNT
jgi:hypothetical protein